jgi:hypothetical protein
MKSIATELSTYCELHWWNFGKKTLSFKGELKDLLKEQKISFTKRKTNNEFIFKFTFKNNHGISFSVNGLTSDFAHYAKQFIQMELVRMGDKSQLYVSGVWRPVVNVNF